MYVQKKVEQGLADSKSGNIVPDEEMAKFWERWSEK
jgi:predicted transcriptional regulator